jgi:hypothetical protein
MKKKFDPYVFLVHAELHCRYGGGSVSDRLPDAGDRAACAILFKARLLVDETETATRQKGGSQ